MNSLSGTSGVVLAHQLCGAADSGERVRIATEALEAAGSRFDPAIADVLLAELDLSTLRALIEAVPETTNSAYLRAMILSRNGHTGSSAWESFLRHWPGRDHEHLLSYAQALAGERRYEEAASQLRLALSKELPYAFFARAQKLVEKLAREPLAHVRKARIAVLGTSTISLLVPMLQALALRDRIRLEIYEGRYGAMSQEILDPESGLTAFQPQIVFLVQNWRDLALPAHSSAAESVVEHAVETQKGLWKRLTERFQCHVVQHAFDFPIEEAYGYLADSLPGGRARVIARINLRLQEEAPSYVSILNTAALQRRMGDRWADSTLWFSFKQHPSTEALPVMAEEQQAHVRAVLGLTRKVLVTDLDNTLWKGIIGEDGVEGIEVGPGTAAGEAHQKLQEYMLELKSRGVVLAVCSKNDLRDARLPFEQHESMVLGLEDFSAFYANWDDKAENLRKIAKELELGLDTLVFLDDNPMEREWVRSQLPEVAVADLGSSVFRWVRDLDRCHYFFSLALSGEDLIRADHYRSAAERQTLQAAAPSLEEFLNDLQLEATIDPVSEANLQRVTQLINKTNQFNLTTRRYTEEQLLRLTSLSGGWTGAFHLWDRLGAYGLVGVILCQPGADPDEWEINTWLMSCRALGRRLENFMFDRMMEAAAERKVKRIIGSYRPTSRNNLVADLYDKLGFTKLQESDGQHIYSTTVPLSPAITATCISQVELKTSAQKPSVQAVTA